MSDRIVKFCDFCGIEIEKCGPGHGFILTAGDFQAFITQDGAKKDACARCCAVIGGAIKWLGLDFDNSLLWLQAGYTHNGKVWVDAENKEPNYTDVYGWEHNE